MPIRLWSLVASSLVAVSAASGCVPQKTVTAAEWIAKFGPGLQAAIEAGDHADKAYNMIVDTPIKKLREDPEKRAALAELVSGSRDAYRRATSYGMAACFNEDPRAIAGATRLVAPRADAVAISVPGRSVQVVAASMLVSKDGGGYYETPSNYIFIMSSRGQAIVEVPHCGKNWPDFYFKGRLDNSPTGPYGYDFAYNRISQRFSTLLLGDDVKVDDIVVDVKR